MKNQGQGQVGQGGDPQAGGQPGQPGAPDSAQRMQQMRDFIQMGRMLETLKKGGPEAEALIQDMVAEGKPAPDLDQILQAIQQGAPTGGAGGAGGAPPPLLGQPTGLLGV